MASDTEQAAAGWRDVANGRYGPALALVCMGVWLHAADSLLVATMLAALVAEVGGEELVGWMVTLYEIGTILTGAAGGLLAIRYGVRVPMGGAALLFAAGCAISALAPTMWVVLFGRLLQGFGGGGLMALSFVAAGILFPAHLIPRVMAAVSALWGVSAFLGPLIGGLFVEYADWRSGFWFFAAQALALAAWIAFGPKTGTKRTSDAEASPVSIPRLALLGMGVVMIAYGGVEVAPVRTTVLVLAGLLSIAAFLVLDGRSGEARLLPRRPFGLATPTGAALTMIFSLSVATVAIVAYGPLLIIMLHGLSALATGYIVACASIGWTIAALIVAGYPERHDMTFIAAGMTVVTASVAGFLYAIPNGPVWLIVACATAEGAGFGMAWTFILRQTTRLAPAGDRERIAGAIPTVQRLGYATGAAYVGIVANAAGFAEAAEPAEVADAAVAVFAASLVFAAIGLAATGRFVLLGSKGQAG